jgi:Ca2+/Na+ antiporter
MKPQLIKRSLIENLYKENNKKVFNSINLQNNVFFNILIIFFLLFCFIFLFYRYSNNKSTNNNEYYNDDDDDSTVKSTTKNEKYNKEINYQKYPKENIITQNNSQKYPKVLGNKGYKQKFVNNKISDYFINNNPANNMLGDIQKYKELSNKYNLE